MVALPRLVACALLSALFAVAAHAQDTRRSRRKNSCGRAQAADGQGPTARRGSHAQQGHRSRSDPAPMLYMLRSRARDSSGSFDQAVDDATKYIELEPTDEYGYLNRARIYLSLERHEKALEDANKAIELKPEEPDGYLSPRRRLLGAEQGCRGEGGRKESRGAGRQSASLMPAFSFCPNCAAPLVDRVVDGEARRRGCSAQVAASFTTTTPRLSLQQSSSTRAQVVLARNRAWPRTFYGLDHRFPGAGRKAGALRRARGQGRAQPRRVRADADRRVTPSSA